jgi:hypothetical protein
MSREDRQDWSEAFTKEHFGFAEQGDIETGMMATFFYFSDFFRLSPKT